MIGELKLILCDIGNTSFHFLINNESKKYYMNETLPIFNEPIYYISVNLTALARLKETNNTLIDVEKYLNFPTQYKGLGLDRKLACLNAKNEVIIDAGSCIKVDLMENGIHRGGFILPGLKKLHDLYPTISPVLNYDLNLKQDLDKIPLSTQEAISYGILKAIILPIKEFAKNKQIIITGGDAKELSSYFPTCTYDEHLIFNNMKGLINANNCIT